MDFENEPTEERPEPTLEETITALREAQTGGLNRTVFYGLSDLSENEIPLLSTVWDSFDGDYRRRLTKDLVDAAESNLDLDYVVFGMFLLHDPDDDVRAHAIDLLWADESLELLAVMKQFASGDASVQVRASAVGALGKFVLRGEYAEIPKPDFDTLKSLLKTLWENRALDTQIRRRALESLANSSDPSLHTAIQEAYDSHDLDMQTSAIFAMGRSVDSRWEPQILKELESDEPAKRYEAARAAGEIVIEEAIMRLSRMALQDDTEVEDAAIWALGEIGGKEAKRVLSLIIDEARQMGDDSRLAAAEEALDNAQLGDDMMMLFDMDLDPNNEDIEDLDD